jgi:hypothetical protein
MKIKLNEIKELIKKILSEMTDTEKNIVDAITKKLNQIRKLEERKSKEINEAESLIRLLSVLDITDEKQIESYKQKENLLETKYSEEIIKLEFEINALFDKLKKEIDEQISFEKSTQIQQQISSEPHQQFAGRRKESYFGSGDQNIVRTKISKK